MEKKPYKAKKVRFDKKLSMTAYVIVLILAVVVRTIQLNTNMNFSTGKYTDSSLVKNYTFWVLLIGFVLIALILFMGKSRDKAIKSCILINPMRLRWDRLNKKLSPAAGGTMILMAGLMVLDIILDLASVASKNAEISTEEDPVFALAGISAVKWLGYVCMLFVIITLITAGANLMKGEGLSKGNCVFFMFIPIWKLLEIFSMFSESQLVGVYSENVYVMLTDMTASMFFICAARLFAGYEKKNTRIWMCFYGYTASILAAVSVVPRYVCYFTLDYMEREGMSTPATSDVGIAIVAIALVAVFWSTYVYRVMPKLSKESKRRWMKPASGPQNMKSIEDELKLNKNNKEQ